MTHSRFIPLLLVLAVAVGLATTSCRQKSYTQVSSEQLVKMPAFQAKVERIFAKTYQGGDIALAVVALKTDDGRRIGIGGERKASAEMMGFAQSLKEGQTYTFPDVFLAYQKTREDKK